MASELGFEAGKRAGWSSVYQGDRPRDILGLTEIQEATLAQFLGFTGRDQNGKESKLIILKYEGTTAPTLTNYASTPVGTIIIAPKLAIPKIFIHQVQSATPVVGDWFGITSVQET